MLVFEDSKINKILIILEERGFLDSNFKFCRNNNELVVLGRGGFSKVYEVYDVNNHKLHYALKVIGFEKKTVTSDQLKETTRLQYMLSQQSCNIQRVINTWGLRILLDEEDDVISVTYTNDEDSETDGILVQFVLMEKLETIITKDKFHNVKLNNDFLSNEDNVIAFAKQIGEAIKVSHNNSVLHRDIKLENIFWDEKRQCFKLGDFSIAKFVEDGNAETIVFTDGYGAPEIECRVAESYNNTSDIYSFGISLYLLLNNLCFPGSEGYSVNIMQYSEEFNFPAPVNASEGFARIIRKMCSYYPADRYQTMEEVLLALNELSVGNEDIIEETEDDIRTETFREGKNNFSADEKSDDTDVELSRQERIELEKIIESEYEIKSLLYVGIGTIIFAFFMECFLSHEVASSGLLWLLSFFAIVTAITQSTGVYNKVFKGIILVLTIPICMEIGISVPVILLAILALVNIMEVTLSAGAGLLLWLLHAITLIPNVLCNIGNIRWTKWIALIAVFLFIYRCVVFRYVYGKEE